MIEQISKVFKKIESVTNTEVDFEGDQMNLKQKLRSNTHYCKLFGSNFIPVSFSIKSLFS